MSTTILPSKIIPIVLHCIFSIRNLEVQVFRDQRRRILLFPSYGFLSCPDEVRVFQVGNNYFKEHHQRKCLLVLVLIVSIDLINLSEALQR